MRVSFSQRCVCTCCPARPNSPTCAQDAVRLACESGAVTRWLRVHVPASLPPILVAVRRTLCDPYLNLFRGLIPPLGGTIDLSPILAFIVLDVRFPHFPGSNHMLGGL